MSERRDAVVIGAGITGLVAAYELRKRGLNISVLERSNHVGGVMRSERRDGFLIEYGPNSFLESPEAMRLISELNLESEFAAADPKAPRYIYFKGALQSVPMNPFAFLASPLLSLTGKLRIFAEPFIKARRDESEESIADFVRRRIGKEAHDLLVAPFVSGVYAGNTEKLSIQACFPKLAELESEYGSLILGAVKSARKRRKEPDKASSKNPQAGKRLCSFRSGIDALPRAVANRLDDALIKSCESLEIEIGNAVGAENQRYRLRFKSGVDSGELTTNNLILTVPASEAARMLSRYASALAAELEAIEYAPMAIVYLSFDKQSMARSLDGFGFLVPRNEGVRLLGSVWSSSLFPSRAPEGRTLLTNFIGGAHDPSAVDLSDDELAAIVGGELQSILGSSAKPETVGVWKMRRAIPQYSLGHAARVKRISKMERDFAGLYLAGNYLQGVSVPDCIARSIKLAASIKAEK